MTLRRKLIVAGVIAVALTIAFGPVVLADDCAAPGDCSNTAWAVGGGAAAVAIALAAATSSWLPGHPEDGLSRECYEALDALLQRIRGTMGQIAELVITRRGAQIEHDAVEEIGRRTQDMVGDISKSLGIVGDVATYSGGGADLIGATGSMSQALLKARSAALTRQLNAVTSAVQASGVGAAELGAIRFAANAANAGRQAGIDKVGKLGTGFGVLSLFAAAASTIAGLSRERQLNALAQLKTLVQLKQGEAWRYQREIDELTDRIYALDPELTAQVNAYNAKAAECHARPLERPTLNSMIGAMEGAALPMGGPPDADTKAPESVLPGPPPPVTDREPPSGCDREVYQQELDDYTKALEAWKEARGYLVLWRRHVADLEASIATVDADWQAFQAKLTEAKIKGYGSTGVSAAATMVTLVFTLTPLTCVVLGVVSVTADLYGRQEGPSDSGTIAPALFKNQLDWLRSRRPYFNGELERRRDIFNATTDNMMDLWHKVAQHQNQCAWSVSPAWPNAESPPDILERNEGSWDAVVPRVCKYQEIGTWL